MEEVSSTLALLTVRGKAPLLASSAAQPCLSSSVASASAPSMACDPQPQTLKPCNRNLVASTLPRCASMWHRTRCAQQAQKLAVRQLCGRRLAAGQHIIFYAETTCHFVLSVNENDTWQITSHL